MGFWLAQSASFTGEDFHVSVTRLKIPHLWLSSCDPSMFHSRRVCFASLFFAGTVAVYTCNVFPGADYPSAATSGISLRSRGGFLLWCLPRLFFRDVCPDRAMSRIPEDVREVSLEQLWCSRLRRAWSWQRWAAPSGSRCRSRLPARHASPIIEDELSQLVAVFSLFYSFLCTSHGANCWGTSLCAKWWQGMGLRRGFLPLARFLNDHPKKKEKMVLEWPKKISPLVCLSCVQPNEAKGCKNQTYPNHNNEEGGTFEMVLLVSKRDKI